MKDWSIVFSSAESEPSLIDTSSSPTTVYERKNIEEIPETRDENNIVTSPKLWKYSQREWTKDEWNRMEYEVNSRVTQILMQNLSDITMSQELNEVTAKEERQMIAQGQSELELAIAQMEVV